MTDMNVQQGFIPWDEIPDGSTVPDGVFQVRGESLEATVTSTGKKMYSCHLAIEGPDDYAGMMLFENFVIGSEEDPNAQLLSTWKRSVGARRMKAMLAAAQMPQATNEGQITAGFKGTVFLVSVTQYEEKDGDYKGMVRNRIGGFHRIGERAVGLGKKGGARAGGGTSAVAPPAAPPVAPPVAPPRPAAPPPSTPPTVTAPMPPPAMPTPTGAPSAMITCPLCQEQHTADAFRQHLAKCMVANKAA